MSCSNPALIVPIFESLLSMTKIFYSLSFIDLPAHFEDHLSAQRFSLACCVRLFCSAWGGSCGARVKRRSFQCAGWACDLLLCPEDWVVLFLRFLSFTTTVKELVGTVRRSRSYTLCALHTSTLDVVAVHHPNSGPLPTGRR